MKQDTHTLTMMCVCTLLQAVESRNIFQYCFEEPPVKVKVLWTMSLVPPTPLAILLDSPHQCPGFVVWLMVSKPSCLRLQ